MNEATMQRYTRDQMAARVARDIPEGSYVILGIGLPTRVANHLPRDRSFANGRTVRNLFERLLAAQAARLHGVDRPTDDDLRTLAEADVRASLTVASSDSHYPGYV